MSQPPNGMSIGSAVLHSTPVYPAHDYARCNIRSNKPHLCNAVCRRCGL